MSPPKDPRQWTGRWAAPWLLAAGVFLLVAATAPHYGLTWDEPAYFHASDLHIQWFADFWKNLFHGQIHRSLQDEVIKAAWHSDPYYVPHPPFSRILSGLTKALFSPFLDKFVAYRFAPALFFALLVTVMYLWMTELFNRAAGLFSALTLILIPNLFGFAHFAVTDMPLTAMWFLTAYCFWRGLENWKWSVLLGIVWGLALATKFPVFLMPIPLLLWAHIYYRRSYANNLFAMIFLSPLVMIASQPYLWHQTFLRILEFLYEGVSRAYRPETNYFIFFFGRRYFTSDLPWYYPFFMVGITTPETILALSLIGVASIPWLQGQRAVTVLWLFNAAFILIMGLLPGAVLHDGVRQLLPLLPFLGALAGVGLFRLVEYLTGLGQKAAALKGINHLKAKIAGVMFLLLLFPPALDLFLYHPYELSYYNRLVGGIRGAYQRGLEVTYFMEAFTPDFMDFLNKNLPQNSVINASFSNFMFAYYQEEGRLRQDFRITEKEDSDYYILLNRRSASSGVKRVLSREDLKTYASVQLASVPLVLVYKTGTQNSKAGK